MVPVEFEPPGTPLTNQVTVVLLAFCTVAVNCWVPPTIRLAEVGLMVTLTADVTVTLASALFVGSATDRAVTMKVPAAVAA